MKRTLFSLMTIVLCLTPSCSLFRKTPAAPSIPNGTLNLAITKDAPVDKYVGMDYGIRLLFEDNRSNTALVHLYDAGATSKPSCNTNPAISSFVPESMRRYMRTMGFNMDADVSTDYLLQVTLTEYHVDYLSGIGWNATVMMEVKAFDHTRTLVYPSVEVVGRAQVAGSPYSLIPANTALNMAYTAALEDIDWDRIAFFLHKAQSPKQEANKRVTGDGTTALESLTIHWDINSRPQGADISWRIVSSTPEVKNQNYRYLQTTPYETTEVLDIKGLTYNNAGNVQIEIKCEKTGYYSQSKKFNVLSIIDEKEISAFFRLVIEDEQQ